MGFNSGLKGLKLSCPIQFTIRFKKKTFATMNLQFSFFIKGHNIKEGNKNYLDVLKQNDFARQG